MEYLITKLDNTGRGITYIDGKITFVSNALPGEVVEVSLTKMTKKYNEGIVTKFVKTSKDRIEAKCPYYKDCGGCNIMHLDYESTLEFKKQKVKEILSKYAGISIEPKVIPSDKRFNYRNKITLHYKEGKLGYMKSSTNEVINITSCPLVMEEINSYISSNNSF